MNLLTRITLLWGGVFCLVVWSTSSPAQTFNNSFNGPIPDNNTDVLFPIVVSGLPSQIDTAFGLVSVCLDITHTYTADLRIKLIAPDSTIVLLAHNLGGGGDNFTNTCLMEDGTSGFIVLAGAPFTGDFIPEESLNMMNTGMDPNGIWYLCVKDEVPVDAGFFNWGNLLPPIHLLIPDCRLEFVPQQMRQDVNALIPV